MDDPRRSASARAGGGSKGRAAKDGDGDAASSFEYRSPVTIGGVPLLHVVRGVDPSTGRRPPAIGIVAVGQIAVGLVAVGQVAFGAISVGQASIGLGWGIGQLAFGLLAAGQVAAGVLGSVGQVACGPHALAMVHCDGAWVAMGWLLGGLWLAITFARQRRRLAPLFERPKKDIAALGDGYGHVAAKVISNDQFRAPLSSRPCVFWHAVHVGPVLRAHERTGGEIVIADSSGTARADLGGEVLLVRNDGYREIPGPDWALHLETLLAQGDDVHIAGPVTMTADADGGAVFRGGGLTPLFYGRPGEPLIVTTRSPALMRAEVRFAAVCAWALMLGGLLAAMQWALG